MQSSLALPSPFFQPTRSSPLCLIATHRQHHEHQVICSTDQINPDVLSRRPRPLCPFGPVHHLWFLISKRSTPPLFRSSTSITTTASANWDSATASIRHCSIETALRCGTEDHPTPVDRVEHLLRRTIAQQVHVKHSSDVVLFLLETKSSGEFLSQHSIGLFLLSFSSFPFRHHHVPICVRWCRPRSGLAAPP